MCTYRCRTCLIFFLALSLTHQNVKAQLKALPLQHDLRCLSSTFSDYVSQVKGLYLEHEERQVIKLLLQYQGFEDDYLWVEVLDKGMQPLKNIPIQKAHLQGLRSPLGITLTSRAKEEELIKSHFIRVSFSQNPQKVGGQIICYTFRLEKKWGINFTPEAGPIVRAKFSPSGTASILEKGFLPKPKKKLITNKESKPLRQVEKVTAVMDSVDRQPYGPTQRKVSIWGEIYQDAMLMYEDILPIDVHLYEDENPASLTYYYVPNRFTLQWDDDKGYQLLTAYGGMSADRQQTTVRVHARLDAGILPQELAVMEELLKVYTLKRYGSRDAKLLPLPIRHQPEIRLNDLEMYGTQSISIQGYTQLDDAISIAWQTDTRNLDEMMVLFSEGMGINGNMTLVPDADSIGSLSVPVYLNFADTYTLGQLSLDTENWRDDYLVNRFPFPISVGQLHLLFVDHRKETAIPQAYVYSFDSELPRVPEGGRVFLDLTQIPHWIDKAENLQKAWLSYEVLPCEPCFQKIRTTVTNGTSASTERQITFEVLDILVESGAKKMTIDIRSPQASSSGSQLAYLPAIQADRDGIYHTGPLYISSGQLPAFEYRITLIMEDGQKKTANHWERSTSTEVYLSSHQLKTLFPDMNGQR